MSTDVPTYAYVWEQGADLVMQMVYKTGADVGSATPVDLTGYNVRMDISDGTTRVYSFNSVALTDVTPTDSTLEATLDSSGNINITVPRSLTLTGGAVYTAMNAGKTVFFYDVFLRDPSGKQKKILSGQITVNKSYTLWT